MSQGFKDEVLRIDALHFMLIECVTTSFTKIYRVNWV